MAARKALIGSGAVITGILAAPYLGISLPNPFITPGTRNIEHRFTVGGGTPNGNSALATKLGDANQVEGGAADRNTAKGIGTPYWDDHYGDQKPPPSRFDKNWNQAHYGTERGK